MESRGLVSTAVLVMNPRRIEPCIASFESLDVDLIWLTGMTQAQLVPHVASAINDTHYDAYAMCADDCIVSQDALDAVLELLSEGHSVATGWCRLDATSPQVNLTQGPIIGDHPTTSAYGRWWLRQEVLAHPSHAVPTGFAGMALTAMPREMWMRYPYRVYGEHARGFSSDFNLSRRLRDTNVPVVAARDGEIEHVKERWNALDKAPEKRLLIGEIEPEVRLDRARERHGAPA